MKKKFCLISAILLFMYAVLSFIPGMLESEYWTKKPWDIGYRMKSSHAANMYVAHASVLSYIVLVLVIISIIALIRICLENENTFTNIAMYAPVVATGVYLFFGVDSYFLTLFERVYDTWFYRYSLSWGYILGAAFLIPSAIICVMISMGKFQDNQEYAKKFRNNDSIDELRKYKELMDAGIITQEEFDVKKKQILEL